MTSPRLRHRSVWPKRPLSLLLLLAVLVPLAPAAVAQAPGRELSDDDFIERLGNTSDRNPVDRKRLAKMLFSLAATLDGGKSSVNLLQGRVTLPDATQQAVRSLLRSRYEDYHRSLATFKRTVSALLDEPDSMLVLYRSLQEGQRTCWHFDLYNRLIETYGTNTTDLISILSSREACGRVRATAFQPRVQSIVMDALVEQVYQRAEIRELREDLRDLEELLADLRAIEDSE